MIILNTRRRIWAGLTASLLLGYWGLMSLVPVPGYGAGNLTPAGNLASFIDRQLMAGHLWRPTWDPEGVLSTIPAIATVLLGALAAEWTHHRATKDKAGLRAGGKGASVSAGLLVSGVIAVVLGELWARVFPINKNLWTSSFVLFTAGLAAIAFAGCYWAIEVKKWQRWGRLFVPLGMNPLAIYVASEIISMGALSRVQDGIYDRWLAPLGPAPFGSLLWAVAYLCVWECVAWLMYRNAIFIRL